MQQPSDASQEAPRRKLAVLIGIDQYQGDVPTLTNAVRDVRAVAKVLRELHGYETRCIEDGQANLQALRRLLSDLSAELGRDDYFLLYFAGHGVADSREDDAGRAEAPQGYLIPADARRDSPDSFLPMAELQTALSKLPCLHMLVSLDCCFAGAFRWSTTRDMRVRRKTLYSERLERYIRDPARQVLVSAASDERALDLVAGRVFGQRGDVEQNSPFAVALCSALRGNADLRIGGSRGDGVIVASELHLYIEESLKRLEERSGHRQQRPLLWALPGYDKGEYVFTIAGHSLALPSAMELNEKNNPYRGLAAYDEKSQALFFGRGALIQELLAQVQAQALTVVVGSSGTGKSSLVCAGVLPRLRQMGRTPTEMQSAAQWQILPPLRPGNRPLDALAALSVALETTADVPLEQALGQYLERHPQAQILLFVDQMEELITMAESAVQGAEFLDRLDRALLRGHAALHVVMTLRADFEPHFSGWLERSKNARFLIRPMNREELREAIELPASECVLYFEPPALVDRIIDEVAEMPGALPLLSFAMSELYRAYVRSARDDRTLTAADYQALGEVTGALSKRADDTYNHLDAAHQATLRRVMLRMVAIEAGEVARRRVPKQELRYGDGHPEEARVQKVLNELLNARLLVAGQTQQGESYIEPAHDKLVLGWRPLWNFLKEEQDTLPLMRRLLQAAVDWERDDQAAERLWSRDPRLPQLVDLQRRDPDRFNALENSFIRSSEAARRLRQVLSVGIVIAIIAALASLTGYAFVARNRAMKAEVQAQAQRQLAEQRLKDALEVAETLVFTVDRKLDRVAGAESVRRELLDHSEMLISKLLLNAEVHRSALRVEEMRLLQEAALLLKEQNVPGRAEAARGNYEHALRIAEGLVKQEPHNLDYQADLAACHVSLGQVSRAAGQPTADGLSHYEAALALYEKLTQTVADNMLWQSKLAGTYGDLGGLLWQDDRTEQAVPYFSRALALLNVLAGLEPKELEMQRVLVETLLRICSPFKSQQIRLQIENGLGCFQASLRINNWLSKVAPQRTDWLVQTASLLRGIRTALIAQATPYGVNFKLSPERQAEVRENLQTALAITERLIAISPEFKDFHQQAMEILADIGQLDEGSDELNAARGMYEQALMVGQCAASISSLDSANKLIVCAMVEDRLGKLHQRAGRLDAARVSYERTVAKREYIYKMFKDVVNRGRLNAAYLQLGQLLALSGEPKLGLEQCERAVPLLPVIPKETGDPDSTEIYDQNYRCQIMCMILAGKALDSTSEARHRAAAATLVNQLRRSLPAKEWQLKQKTYRELFGDASLLP